MFDSPLRVILLVTFGLTAIIAVLALSGLFGEFGFRSRNDIQTVVMWGTVPEEAMRETLEDLVLIDRNYEGVSYIEKDPRTYNAEFIEALASGTGPDLFLLESDYIARHLDKFVVVPFDSFSERAFRDTFVEGGELYLVPEEGALGMPFTIDPLVLYWNRSILSTERIPNPPAFWDELLPLAADITLRDRAGNITRAAIPLGEYRNIENAKEIVSALALQAGGPPIAWGENGVATNFFPVADRAVRPMESALRFYTDFANPIKNVYTWNRALPEAREAFVAGDSALYIGFASELPLIREGNPNLNFDVALLPRPRNNPNALTFGRMTALAIPKASQNQKGASIVLWALLGRDTYADFAERIGLPPVRRDLLSDIPSEPYQNVFYRSAFIAKGWLEPGGDAAGIVFRDMIEAITSGRLRMSDALSRAEIELRALIGN